MMRPIIFFQCLNKHEIFAWNVWAADPGAVCWGCSPSVLFSSSYKSPAAALCCSCLQSWCYIHLRDITSDLRGKKVPLKCTQPQGRVYRYKTNTESWSLRAYLYPQGLEPWVCWLRGGLSHTRGDSSSWEAHCPLPISHFPFPISHCPFPSGFGVLRAGCVGRRSCWGVLKAGGLPAPRGQKGFSSLLPWGNCD